MTDSLGFRTVRNQIVRCAPSAAANYRAACRGKSTTDFADLLCGIKNFSTYTLNLGLNDVTITNEKTLNNLFIYITWDKNNIKKESYKHLIQFNHYDVKNKSLFYQ